MQRDRFAVARRWLPGAEADLTLGRNIASDFAARAAFHAQRAAEMALKGAIIAATDDHPTTHSCGTLVRELRAVPIAVPDDVAAAATTLDLYYLTSRYPDAVGDADPLDVVMPDDVAVALERAARVVRFASATIDALCQAAPAER